MDATVKAAIITGCFTVVGGAVGYLLRKYFEAHPPRIFQPIQVANRRDIEGKWEGTVDQERGPRGEPISYPIAFDLRTKGDLIKGEFPIHYQEGDIDFHSTFNVEGGFLHDRFLRLNYGTRDRGAVQFGSLLFELMPDGKRLEGRFVGYGALSEKIVYGNAKLKKVKE